MTRGESGFHHQVDSIEWYCESRGHGPTVVLIPSGEGDCSSFERVAASLASDFTVLTFDMPGFSRSSDPPDFAEYSLTRAASEVAALVRSLDLGPATFYGCSSGGVVALCLAADHPDLVRNVAVHEVPLSPVNESFLQLTLLDDAAIAPACQAFFRTQLNENAEAWDALGDAFHTRLARNYVTWVRRYVQDNHFLRTFTPEELRRRPVTWTLGGRTPVEMFFDNITTAHAAGIALGMLPCRHFPQVSIPEELAAHIGNVARG